jgi:hypothetical protein
VNDIAKMIHKEDPDHLATTILAGINKTEIDYINTRCTELDLISVQVYGGLAAVPQQLLSAGWERPYMVTEWGPTGLWEGLKTSWNALIEETSSEKAAVYKSRYEYSIERDKDKCLGSYVFLWGTKTGKNTHLIWTVHRKGRGVRGCRRDTIFIDGEMAT